LVFEVQRTVLSVAAMHKLFITALLCLAPMLFAAETKPIRALMVCGGCCHDYANQKKILSEGISARANVEWTIVHEGNDRTNRVSIYEKPDWWKGFDVVLHNECFGYVEDTNFVQNIVAAHQAGVPGVFLHCSTHSYRMAKTDAWRSTLGIRSMSHDKARDLTVKTVAPKHPVMIGFPTEWLDPKDELYRNEKVWPTVTPLATAFSEESKKDHVVIWVNEYDKTRNFSTTLGHANATMKADEYLSLVTRGLLWSCGKLGADGKPLPGYSAK
jgi:type 1 glutamine amidotransferase